MFNSALSEKNRGSLDASYLMLSKQFDSLSLSSDSDKIDYKTPISKHSLSVYYMPEIAQGMKYDSLCLYIPFFILKRTPIFGILIWNLALKVCQIGKISLNLIQKYGNPPLEKRGHFS